MSTSSPGRMVHVSMLGPAMFPSHLKLAQAPGQSCGLFVPDGVWIRQSPEWPEPAEQLLFEKAGPRRKLYFDPGGVRAAIVTCGGLCPGINNVIRSLFMELHYRYEVCEILGIRNGYLGLNAQKGPTPVTLTRDFVNTIHKEGGTMLGTSRGAQEPSTMVDFLAARKIDMLFCVGGDGTQRGCHAISQELAARGLKIAVVGIPKTIDNDLLYCDRTFGFVTALEKAQEVIHLAHTEAVGAVCGIGLVRLMGRAAGFIACGAAIVSQEVNFVLIPEIPFALEGEDGFLPALLKRMKDRGHAVVVTAEGAGQHLFPVNLEKDASGNQRFHDIGVFLKDRIQEYFKRMNQPADVKYIDPSYIIRSVPADVDDAWLCDRLARNAVHAAMAGKTDLIVSTLNGCAIHVPIPLAVQDKRQVHLESDLWASVLACTGQSPRMGAGSFPATTRRIESE